MDQDDWIRPPKNGEVNTSINDESKKTSALTKNNRMKKKIGGIRRSSLRVLGASRTRSGCVFKTRASKATSSNSSESFSSFSSQPSFSSSSLTAKRRRQRPAIRSKITRSFRRRLAWTSLRVFFTKEVIIRTTMITTRSITISSLTWIPLFFHHLVILSLHLSHICGTTINIIR